MEGQAAQNAVFVEQNALLTAQLLALKELARDSAIKQELAKHKSPQIKVETFFDVIFIFVLFVPFLQFSFLQYTCAYTS